MRHAASITCILLFFIFFSAVAPVFSEDDVPEKAPDISGKYFDPDLESILAVNDRSQYDFLSKLTPDEQRELARMIKARVDDEAGVVVSIMAIVSRFVPAFISAQFADKMEPAAVARISDKVSVGKAIAIAKHLDPEFLAEVAIYQDPDKVTAVVEGLPDDELTEITRILFQRGEYRVVARFSDGLSPEKLKSVAEKINDPATLIEIARYMKNREKTVQTAVALPDDYLLRFMNQLSGEEDYKLAAAVGRELDIDRQVNMLNRMEPEKAAMVASYYPPDVIARIMEKSNNVVPDSQLFDVSRILLERGDYKVIAGIADALSVDLLTRMAENINDPGSLIQIARYMQNKDKIVQTALGLSDDYLLGFMNQLSESQDYELAAAVGREMDIDRQVNLLNRMEPDKAARLASYYSPETIAQIMEKDDAGGLAEMIEKGD